MRNEERRKSIDAERDQVRGGERGKEKENERACDGERERERER
jgi:hypothetical protein